MRRFVAAGLAAVVVLAVLLIDDEAVADTCRGLPSVRGGGLVKVRFAGVAGGYDLWTLRPDVAEAARRVVAQMEAVGARPSSSGALRSLHAEVTPTRSATSLHYLGRALDLYVGAGMSDPHTDPYIITRDGDRLWRVWARCRPGAGARRTLEAVRAGAPPVVVTADVLDLTALLACHGLQRIPARADAWQRIHVDRNLHGGTEWWHFEAPPARGARFGDELLAVHRLADVEGTPPWRYRDQRWNGRTFSGAV